MKLLRTVYSFYAAHPYAITLGLMAIALLATAISIGPLPCPPACAAQ